MGLFKPKTKPAIKAKMERPGVRFFVSVVCTAGLPVPDNTLSQIYYFDDRIEIDAAGVEYSISMDKITDISIQTSVSTQSHYEGSVGGAVLGAVVAGTLGAAIGGRPKEKKTQSTESYLVISYINQSGNAAYIAFNALYTPKCRDMVTLFQQRNHTSKRVNL